MQDVVCHMVRRDIVAVRQSNRRIYTQTVDDPILLWKCLVVHRYVAMSAELQMNLYNN